MNYLTLKRITTGIKISLLICIINAIGGYSFSQNVPSSSKDQVINSTPSKRINFFIVNHVRKPGLVNRTIIWRAKFHSFFHHKQFIVIVANSAGEMSDRVIEKLNKHNARIGTIWFDSHGHYEKGYSSFTIGKNEFSYHSVCDSPFTTPIKELSTWCDSYTNIIIGSCYGGASYQRTNLNTGATTRMNGDSLMMCVGNLLPQSNVYGCESWIMCKPGFFSRHSYGLSGYPLQKRFRDVIFEPVWEHMGIWNHFSTNSGKIETVNTIALNTKGALRFKSLNYLSKRKSQKLLARHLKRLQQGVYKA